jgi:hypothetical protein
MTNLEIILQLSEVIAEQKKQISSLESSNNYLRTIDNEKTEQIKLLTQSKEA